MHPHPPPPFYETAGFWLYVAAWVPYTLFVCAYALRSPWRETAAGRGLMAVSAAIVAVLSNVLFTLIFGDYEIRDAVRLLLLGATVLAGSYQLRNLLVLQREGRRADREADLTNPSRTSEETR